MSCREFRRPTKGVCGDSRLFRWNDITSDQTIGTAPKSRMMTAAGVTNAQPATDSERRDARAAVTATLAAGAGQDRVHLRRRLVERGLRLGLAEQHRHDHRAKHLRDLRVGRDLRAGLPDVAE